MAEENQKVGNPEIIGQTQIGPVKKRDSGSSTEEVIYG